MIRGGSMNIVLGATGQIGSMVVSNLSKKRQPVRAIIRDEAKGEELRLKGIDVFIADYLNKEALISAFQGAETAFLLTPENPNSKKYMDEVDCMISNYREAVQASGIKKIICLSSMGAQHKAGTGNLLASYQLEHAFCGLDIQQIFVRPAYYYSNWLGYLELIMAQGILPTFFPPDLELPMISPIDVAEFLTDVMIRETLQERVYEICGPRDYSSLEIAGIFENLLNKDVTLQEILPNAWESTLTQAGFSADGVKNLILMTRAVIDGKTKSETSSLVHLSMDFQTYLERKI